MRILFLFFLISFNLSSQNISLNKDYIYDFLRYSEIDQNIDIEHSLTVKPINIKKQSFILLKFGS